MKKTFPLYLILRITIVLGILHITATYLKLYWRIPYFDKLVHFAGGFLMSFIVLAYVYFQRMPHVHKSRLITVGFITALVIGLAWEVFEFQAGITSFNDFHFVLDNGGDVIFDIVGGIAASVYFIRKYNVSNQTLS